MADALPSITILFFCSYPCLLDTRMFKVSGKKSRQKVVPYVKGFRPPTNSQKIHAAGKDAPVEFQSGTTFFEPIPKCTSIDDWLAQYVQTGQTYAEYLTRLSWRSSWFSNGSLECKGQTFVPSGKTITEKYPHGAIYILPVVDIDDNNRPHIDELIEYTQLFFNIPVKKHPSFKLERKGKNLYWIKQDNGIERRIKLRTRHNKGTGRIQFQVDLPLMNLAYNLPDDALCMIALTMADLYVDEADLFVSGMARPYRRVAIFSLFRYDPNLTFSTEFWYDIQVTTTVRCDARKKLILLRSCRLLVHELAHLLGVEHCIYYSCCMNGSGHLEEDFRQAMFLCPVDLRKLQHLCGFDVIERYRGLQTFYQKYEMNEEVRWIEKRINWITEEKHNEKTS